MFFFIHFFAHPSLLRFAATTATASSWSAFGGELSLGNGTVVDGALPFLVTVAEEKSICKENRNRGHGFAFGRPREMKFPTNQVS